MKSKLISLLLLLSIYSFGQNAVVEYGSPIKLETATKVIDAAKAFALSKQWTVVIAIVDTGGNLVALERLDNTQIGSIEVAIGKAKTANNFKRPSKAFEDGLAGGGAGLRILGIEGVYPLEGGEPIIVNGKIVGAIGVSGMKSTEDGEVVKAGLSIVK